MPRAAPILIALAILLAGCGSEKASSTPVRRATATSVPVTTADIENAMRKDLERWLTANAPAGVVAELFDVTCEDIGQSQFKCGARGQFRDRQTNESQSGHMTALVTVKGGTYTWAMTEPWTAGEF